MASTLNEAQEWAVTSDSPQILVVAGPGSGKTHTLVSRIKRLIDGGCAPEKLLAITFTNAAARQLEQRIESGLGYCGTLHGFLFRLLQNHGERIGYSENRLAILDQEQADEILNQSIKELNYRGSKKIVQETLGSDGGRLMHEIVAMHFKSRLRMNGLMTFDMILSEGLRLIRAGAPIPYQHLFVDEYQDSSALDAVIYREMAIPNKFFIGDPDQSIYSFRGGCMGNILELAEQDQVEVLYLERNYRSGTRICDVAQKLIEQNLQRLNKGTFSNNEPGSVAVRAHPTQMDEILAVLKAVNESEGSSAILLRSNALVSKWSECFKAYGVSAQADILDMPQGWKLCRSMVGLMADPGNDWLCFWLIKQSKGEAMANAARLNAIASGASLNDSTLRIPSGLALASYTATLARNGVSQESIRKVETLLAALPENATPHDLLMAMAAEDDGKGPSEEHKVIITTFHKAKGREWDNVYLPACEEGILPTLARSEDMEESRRLFYVGITRARHNLTISFAKERPPAYGGSKPVSATPSRFIEEAGLEVEP
jgi:DNA helicase-2/ATP-dependent DNA helicase PcrA